MSQSVRPRAVAAVTAILSEARQECLKSYNSLDTAVNLAALRASVRDAVIRVCRSAGYSLEAQELAAELVVRSIQPTGGQ